MTRREIIEDEIEKCRDFLKQAQILIDPNKPVPAMAREHVYKAIEGLRTMLIARLASDGTDL